jgi:hypothetical protein
MQEFIDPTIIHELQSSQDEILVVPTYWFPTLADLIMALEKVMNNVVILFHSFELMTNDINFIVAHVTYLSHI